MPNEQRLMVDVRVTVGLTVLGPVGVTVDERTVPGLAPRHRAVLAHLLLNARTVATVDQLTDALWGPTPPDTARSQIHHAITAVRKVLRTAGIADLLHTRANGYLIQPAPGQFDLDVFIAETATATRESATDPAAATARLRAALRLWRGQPLADIKADYAPDARARLEDRRLRAVEQLAELDLALGRHDDLIDELPDHLAVNPLREKLTAHLVLALHRAGRQPDALTAARVFRSRLADDQGLDPSPAFADLEQAILRRDPALDYRPDQPGSSGAHPVVGHRANDAAAQQHSEALDLGASRIGVDAARFEATSRPVADRIDPAADPAASALPAAGQVVNFLPYDVPDFTGRAGDIERLRGWLTGEVAGVAVIDGMAGVGKTALAVHLAHAVAGRFPDGQLFIDLQGHTPGREPLDIGIALGALLRQLGVSDDAIPSGEAERAALWRARVRDRRVIVVLDNAVDTAQVRPLLAGGGAHRVIVTSRRRLLDLDGAQSLSMELLAAADAVELFRAIVGERADAEPLAALDVLQLCGFLPLAIRIAAARLAHRPQWTVEYLAGRLRDQRRRLTELATPERGVASAFALSYQQLEPAEQRMFRLLGLNPARDIEPHAAAALTGLTVAEAEHHLERLLDAHVLTQLRPGRYTMHDLVRQHARTTAANEESTETRSAAVESLYRYYQDTAARAVRLLFPDGSHAAPEFTRASESTAASQSTGASEFARAADFTGASEFAPARESVGALDSAGAQSFDRSSLTFEEAAQAIEWLDAERINLVAICIAPEEAARPGYTARLARSLHAYLDGNGHYGAARTMHTQALRSSRRDGDLAAQSRACSDLAWIAWRFGRLDEAHDYGEQALDAARAAGDGRAEARAHYVFGYVFWQRDIERAGEHYRQGLALFREFGDRAGEAACLTSLGTVSERLERYPEARERLGEALRLYRELGSRTGEIVVLNNLGPVHLGEDRPDEARCRHRRALDLCRELRFRSEEAEALNGLGEIALALDDPAAAVTDFTAAVTVCRDLGDRAEEARALLGLAQSHRALGQTPAARDHSARALALFEELEVPEADDARALLAELG
ncbi:BTAD domain-containing putative transcriptional regulator [Nocardia sp. NPDC059091]|uniref:AfsR/SARP family transcriptional regulator n=1 Tax=unclassified Nocardia TaxID=2637762 RepID=UPI0036867DD0